MEPMLLALRACAEPTRLRLIALVARGAFCVMDFTEILGQSQPRLSRHLRLLTEAGVMERVREGANVWFTLPPRPSLVHDLLTHLPVDDALLESDRRQAARVLAERARNASDSFRNQGADWDEAHALALPVEAVEQAVLAVVGPAPGRLLDIGTGTGQLLALLAPRIERGLGVDASRAMLALARARLAKPELAHCAVRQADMYRLPLPDCGFDTAVLQMVLHYAEDPAAAVTEAARVLRPGGRLIIVDLLHHGRADLLDRLAHRWPGFQDGTIRALLEDAGLFPAEPITVPGPLPVRLWPATQPVAAATPAQKEFA